MPAYKWSTAASGNWSLASNWTPNGVPGAAGGDTATINALGPNYTVTYDEPTENLNALTINSAAATLVFSPTDFLDSTGPTFLLAGTIDVQNNKSKLEVDGGLTTSSGTTINISTGGTLVYNAATIGGLVDLNGTSAFGGAGNTIALSGTIEATSGTGTVSFAAITGKGTLEANGGRLLVASSLANATVEAVISNSSSSVFETTGALFFGSSVPIDFLGPAGEFEYNNDSASDTSVHFNITGLNAGSSKTTPTNFVGLAKEVVTIKSGGTGSGTTGSVVLSNSDTLTLSGITGDLTKGWVAETISDGQGGTEIFLAVCYAGGTRILTAAGETAVECLKQGDTVMIAVGDQLVARPVKWLGHRRIDLNTHPRPETVAPIRIERDAIAAGMPHRDLLVSPDHAIFVDGMLIGARQLMNGTTIRRERDWASVDYYHVELDEHAILLAEGLPAESYLDTGNSGLLCQLRSTPSAAPGPDRRD